MSLSMRLIDNQNESVLDINWLRNPYGLGPWAQRMVEYVAGTPDPFPEDQTLWWVCNHWAYDQSDKIDRKRFHRVVEAYAGHLLPLKEGYFFFTKSEYQQLILPHDARIPKTLEGIKGMVMSHRRMGIPMEVFKDPVFNLGIRKHTVLEHYQDWYQRLMRFADLLQDESLEFYCSN